MALQPEEIRMQVVVVEDSALQAHHICECLKQASYEVWHFGAPHAMFHALPRLKPGLFIVDWMLPDIDGGQVLQRTRALYNGSVPVMVLTCDASDDTAVRALDLGADDFVAKPVSAPVLQARVGAVLRRGRRAASPARDIVLAPYVLELATQRVLLDGLPLRLTRKEFDLAWFLFSAPHRFVSHAELSSALWGMGADANSHTVAQHVYSLRRKLDLARHGYRLTSVYGAGYRLEPPSAGTLPKTPSDADDLASAGGIGAT
jgi:DNA-binding response OmpR family regulator